MKDFVKSKEESIGHNQNIVNSGYHGKDFFKDMWRTIETGNIWRGEIKNKAKDGTSYWVDTTIYPFLNGEGNPYQYISIQYDITKLKRQEQIIEQQAYYKDTLTLISNRHWLNAWM